MIGHNGSTISHSHFDSVVRRCRTQAGLKPGPRLHHQSNEQNPLSSSSMLDAQVVIGRFALVLLYGALIGIEREARHKNAGITTNALVAIGAAGFAMISDTFGVNNHNPAQIAAMVVTGIGFMGAGVIIHRDGGVQGVTTAATLWANAAVGVTIGTGHLFIGTTIFAAILFTQIVMRPVAKIVGRRAPPPQEFQITIESSSDAITAINAVWRRWSEANEIAASRLERRPAPAGGRDLERHVFRAVGLRCREARTGDRSDSRCCFGRDTADADRESGALSPRCER